MEKLKQRILQISKAHGLSHIGSCLSTLPILVDIYESKAPEDIVLMDNGHASLAHYVVLEKYETRNFDGDIIPIDAEELLGKHGIHANRDMENKLFASNGSLGHQIGIAIGLSEAVPDRKIHVIVSDGSIMEGSNWEALRILSERKNNIQIYANFNGYTAVEEINRITLGNRLYNICPAAKIYHTYNGEGFDSVEGHYKIQ